MSKGGWQTVTWEIEKPKPGPHSWRNAKSFHWTYCGKCGILITKLWGKVKRCNNCGKIFNNECDG